MKMMQSECEGSSTERHFIRHRYTCIYVLFSTKCDEFTVRSVPLRFGMQQILCFLSRNDTHIFQSSKETVT